MKRMRGVVWLSVVAAGLLMMSSLIAEDSGSQPSSQELEIEPLEPMGPTSYSSSIEPVALTKETYQPSEAGTVDLWPSLHEMDELPEAPVIEGVTDRLADADAASSKSVGSANTLRDDRLKGDSWRPRRATVIVEGPSGVVHLIETHDLPMD